MMKFDFWAGTALVFFLMVWMILALAYLLKESNESVEEDATDTED